MLGLSSTTGSPDLSVTLNTVYSWDFGQDVINGLTHELSEGGLGRIGGLGGATPHDNTSYWGTMDLFRYDAAGNPDYTNGRDGKTTYFSSDGGTDLSNGIPLGGLPNKGAPTLSYNNQYNSNGTKNNGGDTADSDPELGLWLDWVPRNAGPDPDRARRPGGARLEFRGWSRTSSRPRAPGRRNSTTSITFSDWSTGSMPIEAQDAYIDGVTVSLNSKVIVNSIATSS